MIITEISERYLIRIVSLGKYIQNQSKPLYRRIFSRRTAFLFCYIDADAGFEFNGEPILVDRDLLNERKW